MKMKVMESGYGIFNDNDELVSEPNLGKSEALALLVEHNSKPVVKAKETVKKETFKISAGPTGVRFKGEVYNKLVNTETVLEKEVDVMFYKKYLGLFDKESYNITICPSKAVFKSLDSNTMLTIASCQGE